MNLVIRNNHGRGTKSPSSPISTAVLYVVLTLGFKFLFLACNTDRARDKVQRSLSHFSSLSFQSDP